MFPAGKKRKLTFQECAVIPIDEIQKYEKIARKTPSSKEDVPIPLHMDTVAEPRVECISLKDLPRWFLLEYHKDEEIPGRVLKMGHMLLTKSEGSITWNTDGEIEFMGVRSPGSSILDSLASIAGGEPEVEKRPQDTLRVYRVLKSIDDDLDTGAAANKRNLIKADNDLLTAEKEMVKQVTERLEEEQRTRENIKKKEMEMKIAAKLEELRRIHEGQDEKNVDLSMQLAHLAKERRRGFYIPPADPVVPPHVDPVGPAPDPGAAPHVDPVGAGPHLPVPIPPPPPPVPKVHKVPKVLVTPPEPDSEGEAAAAPDDTEKRTDGGKKVLELLKSAKSAAADKIFGEAFPDKISERGSVMKTVKKLKPYVNWQKHDGDEFREFIVYQCKKKLEEMGLLEKALDCCTNQTGSGSVQHLNKKSTWICLGKR